MERGKVRNDNNNNINEENGKDVTIDINGNQRDEIIIDDDIYNNLV